MLRSARRRPQPVVVVLHPRAPELALAAPSSNAGSSSASANELVDIGNRPPIVVAGARSQQQQGPYHHQHHQHQHHQQLPPRQQVQPYTTNGGQLLGGGYAPPQTLPLPPPNWGRQVRGDAITCCLLAAHC